MRCPNDGSELIVTEHQGIDIHSCPICRGIWLERIEFDEIVSQTQVAALDPEPDPLGFVDGIDDDFERGRRRRDRFDDDAGDFERPKKGKKRRPRRDMLEDMLDF